MKKYELERLADGYWVLYFWDDEFGFWEEIRKYDAKTTTIKDIYDFVKGNNRFDSQIVLKFIL